MVNDYRFASVLVTGSRWRPQWPHRLRSGSATATLLGLRVRIPPLHGCLSLVIRVCCPVEVFALVQRSPTSVVCLNVITKPHRGGLDLLGLSRHEKIEVSGASIWVGR